MKPLFYLSAIAMLLMMAGCGYASEFGLKGDSVKYDEQLIGDFTSGDTRLSIQRIDNYRVKVDYFKPDELENEVVKGIGRFVMLDDKLFAEVKDGKEYYIVKILNQTGKTLLINILDTEDIGETKFESASEFNQFVRNDPGAFSKQYDRKFKRK